MARVSSTASTEPYNENPYPEDNERHPLLRTQTHAEAMELGKLSLEDRVLRLEQTIEKVKYTRNLAPNMYRYLAMDPQWGKKRMIFQYFLTICCAVLQLFLPIKLLIDQFNTYHYLGMGSTMSLNTINQYAVWYGLITPLLLLFFLETLRHAQDEIEEVSIVIRSKKVSVNFLAWWSLFVNIYTALFCPAVCIYYVATQHSFLDIVMNVMGFTWIMHIDEALFSAIADHSDYACHLHSFFLESPDKDWDEGWQGYTGLFMRSLYKVISTICIVQGIIGLVIVCAADFAYQNSSGEWCILYPVAAPVETNALTECYPTKALLQRAYLDHMREPSLIRW